MNSALNVDQVKSNLNQIKQKLKKNVNLLVVSKTRSEEDISIAYNCGQREFGENQVQELLTKSENLLNLSINWHFIGHLQSNKINQLLQVKNLVSIHSIDSIKLLNKLLSKNLDKKIGIFLQVNTSGESEKSGFQDVAEIEKAIVLLKETENFYLQGLMTIGKIRTDNFEEMAKESFQQLKQLKQNLDKDHGLSLELSMGMSQDYEIAQEYDSKWVRIGSQIFGQRT